jgi:hypothetical protein
MPRALISSLASGVYTRPSSSPLGLGTIRALRFGLKLRSGASLSPACRSNSTTWLGL